MCVIRLKFGDYLRRQNYQEQLINKTIENATNIPIEELRNVRRRDNN